MVNIGISRLLWFRIQTFICQYLKSPNNTDYILNGWTFLDTVSKNVLDKLSRKIGLVIVIKVKTYFKGSPFLTVLCVFYFDTIHSIAGRHIGYSTLIPQFTI